MAGLDIKSTQNTDTLNTEYALEKMVVHWRSCANFYRLSESMHIGQ